MPLGRRSATATIGRVNYELYMSAALSEAKAALKAGDKADGAVAVLDEALDRPARHQVDATGDPTAHAVMAVLARGRTPAGPAEAWRAGHLLGKRAMHHVRRRSPRERRRRCCVRPARS